MKYFTGDKVAQKDTFLPQSLVQPWTRVAVCAYILLVSKWVSSRVRWFPPTFQNMHVSNLNMLNCSEVWMSMRLCLCPIQGVTSISYPAFPGQAPDPDLVISNYWRLKNKPFKCLCFFGVFFPERSVHDCCRGDWGALSHLYSCDVPGSQRERRWVWCSCGITCI